MHPMPSVLAESVLMSLVLLVRLGLCSLASHCYELQSAAFWSIPFSFISCCLKDFFLGEAAFASASA